jgi:vitamin B12 transporter
MSSSPGTIRVPGGPTLAIVAALITMPVASAFADDTNPETVVVSATRIPEERERTGSSVSVVTAQDLADQQILVASDALAELPGLTVVRNGGVGQPSSLLLRGAEAGQTLILMDGVRINDPSAVDDSAILGDLLVNNVDRIEVLRGPQSTLYGSDAIGGVVDVITRRGGDSPFALDTDAEGGSFDTYRLNAAAHGSIEGLDYGSGFNFYHTNGISAADVRNGNSETDGYTHFDGSANLRYRVSESVSIDLRTYDVAVRDDFDDNFASLPTPPFFRVADSEAYGTDKLFVGYVGINVDVAGLSNRIAAIGTSSDRDTFSAPGTPDNFTARGGQNRLEYQGTISPFADNEVTFGAEYQRTTLTTHSIFDISPLPTRGDDAIQGYYGQWQSTLFDALTLTGGVRYDRDDAFGGHVSEKAAGAWALPDGTTVLRGNYGNGFKAPSLYELFSEYSNPVTELKPEVAQGWEVGADQYFFSNRLRVAVTWFDRHTQDQIDFFDCFGPTSPACDQRYLVGGYYYNVDRSRAQGLESEASFALSDTLKASLSYTNMTDTDLATADDLARVPHVTTNAALTWWPVPAISLGGSVGYVGSRFDDQANTIRLSSNTVISLYGSYALTSWLQVFGRMENAFDAHYEPVYGYGAPGRAVFAGIRATY